MDGVGDRKCAALSNLTPLEAARAKTLDELAEGGECGIIDVVSPGLPNGSDTGHLALLGYNPFEVYTGRGPFEALGLGIQLREKDVALRCNFATKDRNDVIVDRRAGRISTEEVSLLARSLEEITLPEYPSVKVTFRSSVEHRGVLVLSGDSLSPRVSDSDTHEAGSLYRPPRPLDDSEEARQTAEILSSFLRKASKILSEHPINKQRAAKGRKVANVILTRGAGYPPKLKSFQEKFGVKAAVVAGGSLYKGVCRSAGFTVVNVEGATGTVNTDLDAKMSAAANALREHDFVLVHVKGTDSASHDKDPVIKVQMIRRISEAFSGIVELSKTEDLYIAATGDHSTPAEIGEHRGDPVPVLIAGPDVRRDDVVRFDEIACARGGIGRIRGVDLIYLLFNYLGKVPLYGD